jgi:hypothetical protein
VYTYAYIWIYIRHHICIYVQNHLLGLASTYEGKHVTFVILWCFVFKYEWTTVHQRRRVKQQPEKEWPR